MKMDQGRASRGEQLIQRMKGDRGYLQPEWEFAARADPDFMDAYNELYRRSLGDGDALSAKIREFVAIGILAFRGEADGVKRHIQRAMRLGATKQELTEAIEATIAPGGAPTFHRAMTGLIEALQQEEAK